VTNIPSSNARSKPNLLPSVETPSRNCDRCSCDLFFPQLTCGFNFFFAMAYIFSSAFSTFFCAPFIFLENHPNLSAPHRMQRLGKCLGGANRFALSLAMACISTASNAGDNCGLRSEARIGYARRASGRECGRKQLRAIRPRTGGCRRPFRRR